MKTKRMVLRYGLKLSLAACLWSPLIAADQAQKIDGRPIQLARYPKAFIASGNISVEVAPYTYLDGKKEEGAILWIKGVEGAWDGKVLNHRKVPGPYRGFNYITTYDEHDWNTIIMREHREGPNYELYVPGVKDSISVVPSDGGAQQTTSQAIWDEYQRQIKQGQ